MGVRFPSGFSTTVLNSPVVTTAETIVAILGPFSPPVDSAAIFLFAQVSGGGAAGTTITTMKLYRGTVTGGTVVGTPATAAWGVGAKTIPGWWVDVPGIVAEQQYSLSWTNAGASANETITAVTLAAFAL